MEVHLALQTYFEQKRKSSPGFSLRALARRLHVSASFLSQLLRGKKAIPKKLLPRLATALDVEPELLATPSHRRGRVERANPEIHDWTLAKSNSHQILRNWYYIPILELTTLSNFDGTAESISRRLCLSQEATEIALRELVALGLLEQKEGRYQKADLKLRFTSSSSTHLIRRFHDEMLERAQLELRTALTEEEFQKRLIAGITVSATPEAVQAAKRKLAECLYEIANDLTSQPGTEVYHLSGQLFPLTKR